MTLKAERPVTGRTSYVLSRLCGFVIVCMKIEVQAKYKAGERGELINHSTRGAPGPPPHTSCTLCRCLFYPYSERELICTELAWRPGHLFVGGPPISRGRRLWGH